MPGMRNCDPIRLSAPMPSRNWSTLEPTESQIVATTLMKLIFMARKALDACLISSADFVEVAMSFAGFDSTPRSLPIASGRK
jgi:hypothetical protein